MNNNNFGNNMSGMNGGMANVGGFGNPMGGNNNFGNKPKRIEDATADALKN